MKRNFLFLTFLLTTAFLSAQSADEIVRQMDQNDIYRSSKVEGTMLINDRFGTKKSSFVSWSRGKSEMLLEFTSRAEAGQKILRTDEEIYLYYPDAEEVIRLQGAALRQSMLGSDVSYEDMAGESSTLEKYRVSLAGSETVQGRNCHVLNLEAKSRSVAYAKQKIWVDKETYLTRKAHLFSRSGRLLKVMEVLESREIDGKEIPVRTRMSDKMKKNSSTETRLETIELNIPVSDDIFSLEELSW